MTGSKMTETLAALYRREMLSLLQYVRQITPYASSADKPLVARLSAMADSEGVGLEGFVNYLDRSRITMPHVGAFASAFTTFNFMAVRKLVPLLVADQKRGLADLERDLATLQPGMARDEVEKLAVRKQEHLTELEKGT